MPRAEAGRRVALHAAATVLVVVLAAFFGFVGFMKATAPVATLAEHHAWTVALPEWLGRVVGASEIACALALMFARLWPGRIGLTVPTAAVLIVNQIVAAAVHVHLGQTAALPQNAVLMAMLAVLAVLAVLAAAAARLAPRRSA